MARNSNLAVAESGEAPFGYKKDGTPRQRKTYEGPRKQKAIRVVARVRDDIGQELKGASVEVLFAGKDVEAYTDAVDENPGATKFKIDLSKKDQEEE